MNAPILILPALLGALAVSAAKTLPPELLKESLHHDTADKAPLNVASMAAARGAGSTCRLGCNESNVACEPSYPGNPYAGYYGIDYNPHMECAYAFGSDTCIAGPDELCYSQYKFVNCNSPARQANYAYTSTCGVSNPGPPSTPRGEEDER